MHGDPGVLSVGLGFGFVFGAKNKGFSRWKRKNMAVFARYERLRLPAERLLAERGQNSRNLMNIIGKLDVINAYYCMPTHRMTEGGVAAVV